MLTASVVKAFCAVAAIDSDSEAATANVRSNERSGRIARR